MNLLSACNNDAKLKRCFGIFLKQPWPNFLTNIHVHAWCYLHLNKNLVIQTSIQKPANWFVLIKSIDWSQYVKIFSVNFWYATHTHVVNLHSFYSSIVPVYFELFFRLYRIWVDDFKQLTAVLLGCLLFLSSNFRTSKIWKHLIQCGVIAPCLCNRFKE